MNVIGVSNSEGTFEGRPYHNVIFHCSEPFDSEKGAGQMVKTYKVKHQILAEILGKPPTAKDLESLIGKKITCFYDEWKNVARVEGLK